MVDSDRLTACVEYIKRMDIRFIGINPFLGYKNREIDFLTELTDFVEGVIIPEKFSDISVLNSLHKLKTLGFPDNGKTIVDLSNFPNLSTLACDYSTRLVSLESCDQLRHLTLTKFRSGNRGLKELPKLSSLTTLDLFKPDIISLEGVTNFPMLRELTIFRASRLENISALSNIKQTLTKLELDQCKRISSYDSLSKTINLRTLIIGNSAPIRSLSFVTSLQNLEFISFVGTDVVDGDLSPTIGIGYVGFDDRRHYSHKFREGSRVTSRKS